MVNFKELALQYVLEDEQDKSSEIAQKAAEIIKNARASTATVGSWASSIQEWMDGADDNIIPRAKALGFLAATLKYLDPTLLRVDQVQFLCAFFGSMFSHDHKAGVEGSTQALRCLRGMKKFSAEMGVKVLEDVLRIQEDFSKQVPATRREIYELILSLFGDSAIRGQLEIKYGEAHGYVVDLLLMCQRERDPLNLLVWFKTLKILLVKYQLAEKVTGDVFQAFANYFPISLNKHATPAGVTTDDLKMALRECFASHGRLAPLAFPFLLERLDRGEAVIAEVEAVSIKVDILRTLEACIGKYEDPQTSLVPHIEKIWTCLKFEVRHGEVKERIDAALQVLRAIAGKLASSDPGRLESSHLSNYLDLVSRDCQDDLSNPLYAKQAGLLWVTVITANVRSFLLHMSSFVQEIRQHIRKSKSSSHKRDLLSLLNMALDERKNFISSWETCPSADQAGLKEESPAYLEDVWVYDLAPILGNGQATDSDDHVLAGAFRVVAQLARQQSLQEGGMLTQSISRDTYISICEVLGRRLFSRLSRDQFESGFREVFSATVDGEALLAAQVVVTHYRDGFKGMLAYAVNHIRSWTLKYPESAPDVVKEAVARLAFIGSAEIPRDTTVEPPAVPHSAEASTQSPGAYSALQHLALLIGTLLDLSRYYPHRGTFLSSPDAHFIIISGIYASLLQFRDCCDRRFGRRVLLEYSKGDEDWTAEFPDMSLRHRSSGKIVPPQVAEEDPEVYRQFLKIGLFAAWELYRFVQLTPGTDYECRSLARIAAMAAFTIRNLVVNIQRACSLARHVAQCFVSEMEDASRGDIKPGDREFLTRGILEGLWPGAMTELYEPAGTAESLMCDLNPFDNKNFQVAQTRAVTGAILANKHEAQPSLADPDTHTIKRVLRFWENYLKEAVISNPAQRAQCEGAHNMVMYILAGLSARQDKIALDLVTVLHEAVQSESSQGEILARSMGILVKDMSFLTPENHGRVNRLHKQWTYSHFIKPLYARALPASKGPAALRCAIAVLSAVEHCQFTAYQDDLQVLNRLVISVLGTQPASSEVASALTILHGVLNNEPSCLEEHVQTVIISVMGVYQAARRDSAHGSGTAHARKAELARCRKQALLILGVIPTKFEQELQRFSPEVQRLLALASADSVRELRKLALIARESWGKLG